MTPPIKTKEVKTSDLLVKSRLPASDFVINPYVGCSHGCKYCYASFMKRFTDHAGDAWGSFVDAKMCDKPISLDKVKGKTVFLSSVTDPYNILEEKYQLTRKVLEQLVQADCKLSISTKSKLILRDIDLLKQMKNLEAEMSINTLDEDFKNDMDHASSIHDRLETLRTLHQEGIRTVCFISPIFPELTDYKAIVEASKNFIDQYWFENLNLRGDYKKTILDYIHTKRPELDALYADIYKNGDKSYWGNMSDEIDRYCKSQGLDYINFFYHDKLVSDKAAREKAVNG